MKLFILFITYNLFANKIPLSLKEFDNLPRRSLKVYEYHDDSKVSYKGISLKSVLKKKFKNWKSFDEILFHCSDGFIATVQVEDIKRFNPLFATSRSDGAPFKVDVHAQNEKNVPLAPFYLIWDNLGNPDLKNISDLVWPYQVTALEGSKDSQRYSKIFPLDDHPKMVKEGFVHFKRNCISCHAVNSIGGEKGPDLAGLVKEKGTAYVTSYISDPRSVNPESNMFVLPLKTHKRKEIIKSITTYLSKF